VPNGAFGGQRRAPAPPAGRALQFSAPAAAEHMLLVVLSFSDRINGCSVKALVRECVRGRQPVTSRMKLRSQSLSQGRFTEIMMQLVHTSRSRGDSKLVTCSGLEGILQRVEELILGILEVG
jgi:hypothetical protein